MYNKTLFSFKFRLIVEIWKASITKILMHVNPCSAESLLEIPSFASK